MLVSASCDMSISFHGSDKEFEKLVNFIYQVEGKERNQTQVIPILYINNHEITAYNGSCHNIWGEYYLQPDAELYLQFAKLNPNASFEVHSHRVYEGGGGGCETYVKVFYKDKKLIFRCLANVDDMSFPFIVSDMYRNLNVEDITIATSGRSKMFDSMLDMTEYAEDYECNISANVTNKTNYLICNNPEVETSKIKKAKELGIPIISEMKFIRMFGDIFDFEDNFETLFSDITYEEFCECFNIDKTITPELLEELKEFPDENGLIISDTGDISTEGNWEEEVYILGNDGEFQEVLNG